MALAHVSEALDLSFSVLGLRDSDSLEDRLDELQRVVAAERERMVALALDEPQALRDSSGSGDAPAGPDASVKTHMPAPARHLHPPGLPMSPAAAISPAAASPAASARAPPAASPGRVSGLSASVLEFTRLEHECGMSPLYKKGRDRLHAVIDELAPPPEDCAAYNRLAGGIVVADKRTGTQAAGNTGARVQGAGMSLAETSVPRRYGDLDLPAGAGLSKPDAAGVRVDGCTMERLRGGWVQCLAPPCGEAQVVGDGRTADVGTAGLMLSASPAGSQVSPPAGRNPAARLSEVGVSPRQSDNDTLSAILGFLDQSDHLAFVGGEAGVGACFGDEFNYSAYCLGETKNSACAINEPERGAWCRNESKNSACVPHESENRPPSNVASPYGRTTKPVPTKNPFCHDERRAQPMGRFGAAEAGCAREPTPSPAMGWTQSVATQERCHPESQLRDLPDLPGMPRSLAAFLQSQDSPPLPSDASPTASAAGRASTGAAASAVPEARPAVRSTASVPKGGLDGTTAAAISPASGKDPPARGAALAETVYVGVKQKMAAMKAELHALRERNAELQASSACG